MEFRPVAVPIPLRLGSLVAFGPVCHITEGLQGASILEGSQDFLFGEAAFAGKISSLDRAFAIGQRWFPARLCLLPHRLPLRE
jgi:hypothetical protein